MNACIVASSLLVLGAASEPDALRAIEPLQPDSTHLVVRIHGTSAPSFAVMDRSGPFEVVVDWTGLRNGGVEPPRLGPGFLQDLEVSERREEGEYVSRIVIRLADEIPYELRTGPRRVDVWFRLPAGAHAFTLSPDLAAAEPTTKASERDVASTLPEGPLTEPLEAIPDQPPPVELAMATPPVSVASPTEEPRPLAGRPRRVRNRALRRVQGEELPEPLALAPPTTINSQRLPAGPDREPATVVPAEPELPPELGDVGSQLESLPRAGDSELSVSLQAPEAGVPRRRFEREGFGSERLARFPGARARPAAERGSATERLASFQGSNPLVSPPEQRPAEGVQAEPEPPPFRARPRRSGPARVLTYIGFQHMAGTSRAFVRLDGEVEVKTRPSPGTDSFVLELLNTRIELENNARPLDTTFFPGPVTLVQAKAAGRDVHVHVKLRSPAAWKLKRIGTTVAVDFTIAR